MGSYTLFISDLHLDASAPERTTSFFRFLQAQGKNADALYILGDFFDIWIGDDEQLDFHKEVISQLKKYAENVPVFYMHGNHDFMVGKRFEKETNCKVIKDPTTIEIYGEKIVLAHGDGLVTEDIKHMRYRNLYQKSFIKKALLFLPLRLRKYIAKKLKDNSRSHLNPNKTFTFGINDELVTDLLNNENANYLIHGHMHLPNIHPINIGENTAKRIVLDSWFKFGNYLQWEKDGDKSMRWFHHNHFKATHDC